MTEARLEAEASDAIARLRARAERILAGELERSLRRRLKHLGAGERAAVRAMVAAAADALLAGPRTRLTAMHSPRRDASERAIAELFALRDEGGHE